MVIMRPTSNSFPFLIKQKVIILKWSRIRGEHSEESVYGNIFSDFISFAKIFNISIVHSLAHALFLYLSQ